MQFLYIHFLLSILQAFWLNNQVTTELIFITFDWFKFIVGNQETEMLTQS